MLRTGIVLLWLLASAGVGAAPDQSQSIRSGTAWVLAPHFVVTNQHVVGAAHSVLLIRNDDKQLVADVVVRDATNDLVLLKPRDPKLLPAGLPLAQSQARVGASVFTLGYPLLTMMGREAKLTTGYVSARTGLQGDPRAYQISAPIQPGNSGGPVLNMNGEVIGVAAATLSAVRVLERSGTLPQNVNYAIKSDYVRVLRDSALAEGPEVNTLHSEAGTLERLVERIQGSVMIVLARDGGPLAPAAENDVAPAQEVEPAVVPHGRYRVALFVYANPSNYDRNGSSSVTLNSYSVGLAKMMETELRAHFQQSLQLVKRETADRARWHIYNAYNNAKRDNLCSRTQANVLLTALNDATVNGLDQDITYYLYDCGEHREYLLTHRVEPRTGDKFPNEAELTLVFERFLRELPTGLAFSAR